MRRLRFMDLGKRKEPYGLVSRGEDTRLQQSEQSRHEFFDRIIDTFEREKRPAASDTGSSESGSFVGAETQERQTSEATSRVLADLRKLREALLQTEPDDFAKKVYLFSVRVSSAVGHYQTYMPSIQFLLDRGQALLTNDERRELTALLVLHLLHCNNDNFRAMRLFFAEFDAHKDARLHTVLRAWITNDYWTWMACYNAETDHSQYAIMTMGLARMSQRIVECLGLAFFTYNVASFARLLPRGMLVEQFLERNKLAWAVDGENLVIRQRPGQKAAKA